MANWRALYEKMPRGTCPVCEGDMPLDEKWGGVMVVALHVSTGFPQVDGYCEGAGKAPVEEASRG